MDAASRALEGRRRMLNIEKYKDEIKKLIADGAALPGISKDGKLIPCIDEETCEDCKFVTDNGLCSGNKGFIDWCLEDDGLEEDCKDCKHNGTITCNDCSHSHKSMFERKPKKTRQSEFLKMFPNADLRIIEDCDIVAILPCILDYKLARKDSFGACERDKKYNGCNDCRTAYWNEEVE